MPDLVPVDYDPFQAEQMGSQAFAQTAGKVIGGLAQQLWNTPREALQASEQLRTTGDYDPAPVVNAAMLGMTGGVAGVPLRAGEAALGAGPFRGTPPRSTAPNVPKIGLGSVRDFLEGNEIPYQSDNSKSLGSLSNYFYVDTPHGVKKIRESDHFGGVGEDLDIRLGENRDAAFSAIAKTLGRPFDPSMARAADNAAAERVRGYIADAQQAKENKIYDAYGPYDYDSLIARHQAHLDEILGRLGAGAPESTGIRAYHGSPYDFDKFDLSKMGTGEGAQAYGHGLYFAENPEVAQQYRENLSSATKRELPAWFKNKSPSEQDDFVKRGEASLAMGTLDSNLEAKNNLQRIIGIYRNDPSVIGRIYEVNINADPEHFLDWDKPLSEQSPHVQQAFKKMLPGDEIGLNSKYATGKWLEAMAGNNPAEATAAMRQAGIPGIRYLDQGSRDVNGSVSLQTKYRAARLDDSNSSAERFFASRYKGNGGDLDATIRQLEGDLAAHPNDATVKQTLDFARDPNNQFTFNPPRAQTHNYVVFDDKLVDIIKKYGLAGLIAGGAAHFSTQPVGHNPFGD